MLDDRKKAQENKFAHDADTAFRIAARRNRLAAEWAGAKIGKTADELPTYSASIVSLIAMFEGAAALEATVNRLVLDLDGRAGEDDVMEQLALFQEEAERQIRED